MEIGSKYFIFHKGCFHEIIFLEQVDPNRMYVYIRGEKIRIYEDDLFPSVPAAFKGFIYYLDGTWSMYDKVTGIWIGPTKYTIPDHLFKPSCDQCGNKISAVTYCEVCYPE